MKYIAVIGVSLAVSLFSLPGFAGDVKEMYAQHGFFEEKGKHLATNYGVQNCYPVNSRFEVELDKGAFSDKIVATSVDTGQRIVIKNTEKYTQIEIDALMQRMFSEKKKSVGQHSAAVQNAINNCRIIKGMTKNEVLIARGYPPAHATASLDGDTWQYWFRRLENGGVVFTNGVVSDITGEIQR